MNLQPNNAYIGVGSNLGDRIENCLAAFKKLSLDPGCKILRISSFYETEPLNRVGGPINGWFLNAAIHLKTRYNAPKLLQLLQKLEIEAGRDVNLPKWSPRPLDLDLLFFNDEVIKTRFLTVPHPELHKRRFVLEPLAEIAPRFMHPVQNKSVDTLLRRLQDNHKVFPLFHFFLKHHASTTLEEVRSSDL